jgi:nitroimidazol reductase NimA-like FMN-containing flavoprotein (pyridoxamine 5'-phosphate oxidase superfamily)
MPPLTKKQLEELLNKPLPAKIATITPDGWPYVTSVWFAYKNNLIYVIGRMRSEWVSHILNNPRVHVLIDEYTPPYARVHITATAKVIEGPVVDGKWVDIAKEMASKYFGKEVGPKYLQATLNQPRYLIEIPMEKVVTWVGSGRGDLTEWHPRYYKAE